MESTRLEKTFKTTESNCQSNPTQLCFVLFPSIDAPGASGFGVVLHFFSASFFPFEAYISETFPSHCSAVQ